MYVYGGRPKNVEDSKEVRARSLDITLAGAMYLWRSDEAVGFGLLIVKWKVEYMGGTNAIS